MDNLRYAFEKAVKNNPFGRMPNDSITAELRNIQKNLTTFRLDENEASLGLDEWMAAITPQFQRANTKWTQEMQVRFVENLISGYRGEILMYCVGDNGTAITNSYLLDGLQRLTAWVSFMKGDFMVFDQFYFDQINSRAFLRRTDITLKFYTFESEKEACEFYIQMNKNITHSPQDLEVAYEFLNKLKEGSDD